MLFVSEALYSLLDTMLPYITLYFSAQLLNELAGARRREVLMQKIGLLITVEAVMLLCRAIVLRWKNVVLDGTCLQFYGRKRHFDKLLSMDFSDTEEPKTQTLQTEVQQSAMWRRQGLCRIYYQYQDLLEALFRLLGGIALSVSLFRLPVRGGCGLAYGAEPPVLYPASGAAAVRRDAACAMAGNSR